MCDTCLDGFSIIDDGNRCARNVGMIKNQTLELEMKQIKNNITRIIPECSDCSTFQFQFSFYCKECHFCWKKCIFRIKRATFFKGVIVECPNTEFFPDYINFKPLDNVPYQMSVDPSLPNELMIFPVKGFEEKL